MWHSKCWNGCQGFEYMPQQKYEGHVDNGPELAQELVRHDGPEQGADVAQRGEAVVDGRAAVLVEHQHVVDVEAQDGVHGQEGKPLKEFTAKNEEHCLRIWMG